MKPEVILDQPGIKNIEPVSNCRTVNIISAERLNKTKPKSRIHFNKGYKDRFVVIKSAKNPCRSKIKSMVI